MPTTRSKGKRGLEAIRGGLERRLRARVVVALALVVVALVAIVHFATGVAVEVAAIPDAVSSAARSRAEGAGESEESRTASEFIAFQRARGLELQQRAQRILDLLYPGRAIVSVNAELDPSWERLVEKIQPEVPAVVSEDRREGPAVGDPPGGAGERETSRTFEPFAGTRNRRMLAPDIRRLSVALVLDESIDRTKHPAIEDAIKSAVGFADVRRGGFGDEFRTLVDGFPNASPTTDDEAAAGWLAPYAAVVVPVAAIALVLLLSGALWALIRPRSKTVSRTLPEGSELVEDASPEALTKTMRNEIEQTIADDPAGVSRLLEGWLAEHRT